MGAVAGAAIGYLGLRVLFIDGYKLLTGRRGMGLGDAEVLAVVGALLGPAGVVFALGAGAVQGVLVTGVVMLAKGRMGPEHAQEIDDEEDEEDEGGAEARGADEADGEPSGEGDEARERGGQPEGVGKLKVPFVPFLALGALEYLLGADALARAYLHLIRGE
jgi:leader peptidase (prepilin peptidase)/N-methyltransferase